MTLCACGSKAVYADCCQRYLENTAEPPTAELLMRSRYTAYTLAKIDYIEKSMMGDALAGFDVNEARIWAQSVEWIGLNVIKSYSAKDDDSRAFVEFIALYFESNRFKKLHELSEFKLVADRWFYIQGTLIANRTPQVLARNATCLCGSAKKFKNCHGKT